MEQAKRPASSMFLLCISIIALFVTFAGYSLSDVHNTFDFLAPVIGILQFVLILGLFKGRLWGLIGYTFVCMGLLVALFINYTPKGQTTVALKTSLFVVPLLLLAFDYWTRKRSYFK